MLFEDGIIEEKYIRQGSLSFIIHNEKPEKTGWWRKVRNNEEVIYILEMPMMKDFNLNNENVKKSRVEYGACVMKSNTLSYGQNVLDKFNVLCTANGIAQYIIMRNDYFRNIKRVEFDCAMACLNREDFKITDCFEKLFGYYLEGNEENNLKAVARNMLK